MKCRIRASWRKARGTGRSQFLQKRAQARINLLAPPAGLKVPADGQVQRIVAGAIIGRHAEPLAELVREQRE